MTTIQPHAVRTAIEDRLTTKPLQAAWGLTKFEHAPKRGVKPAKYTFRMPASSVLDDLWSVIEEVCEALSVTPTRVGTFHTVEELDDVLGAVEWLWPKWLARGFLTLFVGDPGTGKSMLALDLLHRAIVPSIGWPLSTGDGDGKVGTAVWVETQSSQQLLNIRTKSMGLPRKQILLPDFHGDLLGQPDLTNDADQARLAMLIRANKPRIVIVDSLGGAHTRGENRIEEVRPMLRYLADLARDYDTAVVAIHHLRKTSGDDWEETIQRVRGSSAFVAFPRVVLALERLANSTLKLSVIKSNISALPKPLAVNVDYKNEAPVGVAYTEYTPPKQKSTRRDQATTWAFDYLKLNGKTCLADLIEAAKVEGYSRGLVYEARDSLGDALALTGDGRKVYWELVENPFAAAAGAQPINGNGSGPHNDYGGQ